MKTKGKIFISLILTAFLVSTAVASGLFSTASADVPGEYRPDTEAEIESL